MKCCDKCFADRALIRFVQKRGLVKKNRCRYCREAGGKYVDVGLLEKKFAGIIVEDYVSHVNLSQGGSVDAFEGDYLSNLIQKDFNAFSISGGEKREELLNAILTSRGTSTTIQHKKYDYYFRKSDDAGEFSFEEYSSQIWQNLKEAINKYGHGLSLLRRRGKITKAVAQDYDELLTNLAGVSRSFRKAETFYRARVGKFDLVQELQSPPPEKVRASRCNLQGQPVLYLADSEVTAISEVRPAKHDVVTICAFKAEKELKVCDFMMRKTSPFKNLSKYRIESEWVKFTRVLGKELARPIRPSDEASKYLATQALCGMIFEAEYDGIKYPSAQTDGGKNYVLFNAGAAQPIPGTLKNIVIKNIRYQLKSKKSQFNSIS